MKINCLIHCKSEMKIHNLAVQYETYNHLKYVKYRINSQYFLKNYAISWTKYANEILLKTDPRRTAWPACYSAVINIQENLIYFLH